MIVSFIQYFIASEMARTRDGLARRPNNFDDRRFGAVKEITNARRRNNRFKIKFVLPQSKNVGVKVRGNVARRMRVRKCLIFPAMQRYRQF